MSYNGQKNVYTCPAGHKTVTIDLDEGTTPFILRCQHRINDGKHACNEMARSSFYNVTPEEDQLPVTFEWYKPASPKDVSKDLREHVQKGGLVLRKRRGRL